LYNLEKIEVILRVQSVEDTAKWYSECLGWTPHYDIFDHGGRCLFGSVGVNAEHFIGFNLERTEETPQNTFSARLFIKVDEVDEVYDRLVQRKWDVDGPENKPWGGRVIELRDINGFRLTIYSIVEDLSLDEIRKRTCEQEHD